MKQTPDVADPRHVCSGCGVYYRLQLSSAVAAETRGRRGAVAFIEQLVAEDRARGGFQIKTAPSSRTSSSTALLRAATVAAVGAAALMVGLRVKKST